MGAFFLYRKNDFGDEGTRETASIDRSLEVFNSKGLSISQELHFQDFDLYLYNKKAFEVENYLGFENGDFICATGTMLYKKLFGSMALENLYHDFSSVETFTDTKDLFGEFCVIIFHSGKLTLFNSASGLYHVFSDSDGKFFSSSFLALRRAVKEVTLLPQSFYEYILNGAVYGDKTLFKEIEILDCTKVFCFTPNLANYSKDVPEESNLGRLSYRTAVLQVSNTLSDYFHGIQNALGSDVCSALSGGYDSRLLLGLMRKTNIDPYLYVYGSDNDPDVRVAKNIASSEGLDLDHVDRGKQPNMDFDSYEEFLKGQYFICDGMTNDGIFDSGQVYATRMERVSKARLQLNGGGGEIYRNFWVLPDKGFSSHQFLTSKYDRFDYSPMGSSFKKDNYFKVLAGKVEKGLSVENNKLTRRQIAILYFTFRMRYWMGINNSHNAQFAFALTPFGENSIASQSFSLPLAWKNEGRFEASLIREIDEPLAKLNSCYGHDFFQPPTMKRRIKGSLMRNVPVSIRPYLRKRWVKKSKNQTVELPYYLNNPILDGLGLTNGLAISEFVDEKAISNPAMLSRILSVELLIRDEFL
jgi:hypothetical protein